MAQIVDLQEAPPAIELIKEGELPIYTVVGKLVLANGAIEDAKFGIVVKQLGKCATRGQGAALAQFYNIVAPGLILAKHIFRGLNRPLFAKGNMGADSEKLIYSRKPKWDYEWKDGPTGGPEKKGPLPGRVFVTIVSPTDDKDFPSIVGWIEHWNWVHEAADLKEAPAEWDTRYKEKLWSAS